MNDAQYIREAADKFKDSGAMFPAQIQEQYREIQERPPAPAQPYVHPAENSSVDPIPWQRVAVGTAKITAAATVVAIAGKLVVVGVAAIFAFIEANALVCGGILVVAVIALTASGGNSGGGNSGHTGSAVGGNTITVNNTTIINGGTVNK